MLNSVAQLVRVVTRMQQSSVLHCRSQIRNKYFAHSVTLKDIREKKAEEFFANMSEKDRAKKKKVTDAFTILKVTGQLRKTGFSVRTINGERHMLRNNMALSTVHIREALREFLIWMEDIELTPADYHYMLTECRSQKSIEKHLLFLQRNYWIRKNLKAKKTAKPVIDTSSLLDPQFSIPTSKRETILKRSMAIRTMTLGSPFVIDMDHELSVREQKVARKQLLQVYSMNAKHACGFHLHYTSVLKNEIFAMEHKHNLLGGYFADFHKKPFWELFPTEEMVYLSPYEAPLERFDGNAIYVMGGIVDLQNTERYTETRIKKLGMRGASLPLKKYVWLQKSSKLPLQQVVSIMIYMNLGYSWRDAILTSLPRRLYPAVNPMDEENRHFCLAGDIRLLSM